MSLKFDQLPDILLEEVFKLLNPNELFNYCFLNKCLFKIIDCVIKYNLTYSVYYFGEYQNYQKEFIEKNRLLMTHIVIESDPSKYLNSCPNLKSIEFYGINSEINDDSSEISNSEIHDSATETRAELPGLKKLGIFGLSYMDALSLFKSYLNQIEVFEIEGSEITIKDLIRDFNANKLKALRIYSEYNLYLVGLDVIKAL
ncbi:hypothetical protein K502DRAFT_332797 [Neoconidiobolus thromboides FSU 785]|nr:hypothetical protein K502DRAFT_332797 [Neoconidiobolus thromboides FSU 785]